MVVKSGHRKLVTALMAIAITVAPFMHVAVCPCASYGNNHESAEAACGYCCCKKAEQTRVEASHSCCVKKASDDEIASCLAMTIGDSNQGSCFLGGCCMHTLDKWASLYGIYEREGSSSKPNVFNSSIQDITINQTFVYIADCFGNDLSPPYHYPANVFLCVFLC